MELIILGFNTSAGELEEGVAGTQILEAKASLLDVSLGKSGLTEHCLLIYVYTQKISSIFFFVVLFGDFN